MASRRNKSAPITGRVTAPNMLSHLHAIHNTAQHTVRTIAAIFGALKMRAIKRFIIATRVDQQRMAAQHTTAWHATTPAHWPTKV